MGNSIDVFARLRIDYGPEAGRLIELIAPRFIIGRNEDCQLCVPDSKISRQHATIVRELGKYFVEDLESRNGTFLNGERLGRERRALKTGDELQFSTLLVVRFEDPATTTPDWPSPILIRGLWLDVTAHEVYLQRQKLQPPLSDKLFRLLQSLVERPNAIVSKEQIAAYVWPEVAGEVSDQMIDALVARLRQRLAQADAEHEYIVRVRNQGLRFVQHKS